MWVYEHADWPEWRWDDKILSSQLADVRYRQGRLLGRMEALGFSLKQEASLGILTSDVTQSWAIEGEFLKPKEVRSSLARRLGIDVGGLVPSSRHVDGIVDMMLDATRNCAKALNEQRLFAWHAALFPTGYSGLHPITVGAWRTTESDPMRVVSGPIGKERVHFEAPPAKQLAREMKTFLAWFESKKAIEPLIKSALAHLWFLTIHPFEDGNGRIARAIADMLLARADGIEDRFYSLSAQIERERKEYYVQLERQQRSDGDITAWVQWFLSCLGRAIDNAEDALSQVLFKAKLWKKVSEDPVNERQRLVLNRMLDGFEGFMTTSKYAKMAKCSTDTALRDIQDLLQRSLFVRNASKGRSTSYRLTEKL